jgi:esterase/lipase superfamily enzyme/Tfp pilus assembly protein PilF
MRVGARPIAIAVLLAGFLSALPARSDELGALSDQVQQLYQAGKYSEAVPVAQQALALAEKLHGPDHPDVANSLNHLAALYGTQGRYADAEPLYRRSLAIREKALGPDHPDVARSLNNLAGLYDDEGRYADAEPLYKRALAIDEKALGPDDTVVATMLNNLAALYHDEGRYTDTEPLLKRSLAIREKALGPDNPDVARSLNNLAGLYHDEGRYADAEPLYKHALAVREKALGPDHPDVAQSLNNLAALYGTQGRYADAEPLLKRSLAIDEKALGPDHPDVANSLSNLAALYHDEGRYPDAEPLMKRSIAIDEKALGPEHPDVAQSLNNLAGLYETEGRYADAEPLYKHALAIREKALDSDHPKVAQSLNNLAGLYERQGRLKEAEPLYQRALRIGEKALGLEHPDVAIMRENLGGIYKSLGKRADAEPLLRSALAIKEKVFGSKHPSLAYPLTQLGDLLRLEGKCNEAQPLFLRARTIGVTKVKEVPVLFGTDRKQDTSQPSVAFGGERGKETTFGLVVVTVPNPETPQTAARPGMATKGVASAAPTDVRRLALECIEVVNDQQIIASAIGQIAAAKKDPNQALVFVHGYNVSFESSVRRAAQIAYDLKFDGGVFLFSWPSHQRFQDYLSDRETVDLAAEHLKDFVEKIIAETKITKIHFIAHSMGNMVLLRALSEVVGEDPNLRPLIGEVIDAAPDVDPGVFAQLTDKIKKAGANFALYAAQSDKALWISTLLRGNLPRAGFIHGKPLITPGVDTIDVTNGGDTAWYDLFALNHDIYSSNPILVGDMERIVEKGVRPPDQRTREFDEVQSADGTYWRLRAPQVAQRQ